MSGTIPINDFTTVSIKNNTPTATSLSLSGKRQSKQLAAQYWSLDCQYTNLNRTEAAQVMAFLNKQNNSFNDFDVVLPQYSRPNGTIKYIAGGMANTNVITCSNTAAIGDTIVYCAANHMRAANITANGYSATTAFKAGDFVRFSTGNKTYQLTADSALTATGSISFNIFPGLYTATTSTSTVEYWDVRFHVFNTEQSQEYRMTVGDTTDISLKLLEAI